MGAVSVCAVTFSLLLVGATRMRQTEFSHGLYLLHLAYSNIWMKRKNRRRRWKSSVCICEKNLEKEINSSFLL